MNWNNLIKKLLRTSKRKKLTTYLSAIVTSLILLISIFGPDNMESDLVNKTTNNANKTELSQEGTKELPIDEEAQLSALYEVVKVIDGDTVDVMIDDKTERLRLIGIDTPETVDPRKPVQCFGREASQKAKELLEDKKVRLESDFSQDNRDKYNRLLRYIHLEDGTFYNKIMIAEGYAHEYTYGLPYKYQLDFKQAQKEAEQAKKGFWSPDTCSGNTKQATD